MPDCYSALSIHIAGLFLFLVSHDAKDPHICGAYTLPLQFYLDHYGFYLDKTRGGRAFPCFLSRYKWEMGMSKLSSQKSENGFPRSGNCPMSAGCPLPAARRQPPACLGPYGPQIKWFEGGCYGTTYAPRGSYPQTILSRQNGFGVESAFDLDNHPHISPPLQSGVVRS